MLMTAVPKYAKIILELVFCPFPILNAAASVVLVSSPPRGLRWLQPLDQTSSFIDCCSVPRFYKDSADLDPHALIKQHRPSPHHQHNIMATTPPIKSLPTELITIITSNLTLPNVRNFRRACRWAETETYLVFARSNLRSLRFRAGSSQVNRRIIDFLEKNKQLAGFVKFLMVDFRGFAQSVMRKARWLADAHEQGNPPTAAALLAALPDFERLSFRDLDSEMVDMHLRLAVAWPKLKALTFNRASLSGKDLDFILTQAGPELGSIVIHKVCLESRSWRNVLKTLRDSPKFRKLYHVELADLSESEGPEDLEDRDVYFKPKMDWPMRKEWETGWKVERVDIRTLSASMNGVQGVKLGLDAILERGVFPEEAAWSTVA